MQMIIITISPWVVIILAANYYYYNSCVHITQTTTIPYKYISIHTFKIPSY